MGQMDFLKEFQNSGIGQCIQDLNRIKKTIIPTEILRIISANAEQLHAMKPFLDSSFQQSTISAPEFACLKLNANLLNQLPSDLRKEYRSSVDAISLSSANFLSAANQLIYDRQSGAFFEKGESEEIYPAVLNQFTSATELFDDLKDEEMFDFFRFLARTPLMGLHHPIGRKLFDDVQERLKPVLVELKELKAYRVRNKKQNSRPLAEDEMREPPRVVASHGRYNMPGYPHFYVAESSEGAKNEVDKHNQTVEYQIEQFELLHPIKIVDLSAGDNSFIRACRWPSEGENGMIQLAYLIPCFFGDCCQVAGIDGIKYKGADSYSNYVFWTARDFQPMGSEILHKSDF